MKKASLFLWGLLCLAPFSRAADDGTDVNKSANQRCLDCHGQKIYSFVNPEDGQTVRKLMATEFRIDTAMFYSGAHKTFKCIDCHVPEYDSFPHPNLLRFEPMYTCLDCHGGDETYAKFHFETIDEEFQRSVHGSENIEGFSCWSCHDPHSFRINQRTGESIDKTIAYDNAVCMKCHFETGTEQMILLAGESRKKTLSASHDWLPNQELHFSQVRCIECHALMHDSLLVAHHVVPADSAVKQCKECHSRNTMLLSSWYRFQNIENRKNGFVNGVLLNQAYVIGASRNETLNLISLLVFGATLAAIVIHAIFRIRNAKQKKS